MEECATLQFVSVTLKPGVYTYSQRGSCIGRSGGTDCARGGAYSTFAGATYDKD